MATIATVTGTAIRPGVSKNGRLYTADAIGRMVARGQQRIADGSMPLTTLTHHDAGDDSTRIVGRITGLNHEADGSATYEANIVDTSHGRDIHGLISGPDPVLRGVSIRGAWVGPVRRIQHEGRTVETAEDLELDGLDYTRKPGVDGAGIASVNAAGTQPRESDGSERMPIVEAAPEASVALVEAVTPPMSKRDSGLKGEGGPYADPGYLKDKKQRYQIDTKAHAKAAWAFISKSDNAAQYTSAQLKRVKQRIVKALKGFGVTVATAEGWLIDPATVVTESLAECWDMDSPSGAMYLSLTNGPTTVTVSSAVLDPHDLGIVGRAAMGGACDALMALDPDMDADIDLPGAPGEDTDSDEDTVATTPGSACSCGCGCAVPHPMAVADGCPCGCGCDICKSVSPDADESISLPTATLEEASGEIAPALVDGVTQTSAPDTPAADPTQEKEPAMAESTPTPAADTPGTDNGINALGAKIDKLSDALAGFVTAMAPKPAEAAPAPVAPAVESAPAVAPVVEETQEQMIARLVAEGVKAALPGAVQETVERQGPPSRKGYVQPVTETTTAHEPGLNSHGAPAEWPDKPLHQYTPDERARFFGPALRQHVLQDRFRG
ncbi:DUF6582 domain-containing protein [Streptantibioticus silvisoli]|uniref:Uncharacterized protein n=1 Tax=Streptantibioticus silvisoli TaxID=2705255 RepID=A0ABT6W5R6_9ACTN|nr:DUF6582 domain-containing protein [Streptantibioticus silvisoli]MDI5965725.1 hypothetical protein [Streptantibioticus silvisoli]